MKHYFFFAVLAVLVLPATTFASNLKDDFSQEKRKDRRAQRGDWKFKNNKATCVSDPEQYKKNGDYGPIIRWRLPFRMTDGTVEFEFQPKKCRKIVATLNDNGEGFHNGHVFRIIFMDGSQKSIPSRILGWPKSSKTTKQEVVMNKGIPVLADLEGKWVKVKLTMKGDQATLAIGDSAQTMKHASIARTKGEFSLSFEFGEMAVRNVKAVPAKK